MDDQWQLESEVRSSIYKGDVTGIGMPPEKFDCSQGIVGKMYTGIFDELVD